MWGDVLGLGALAALNPMLLALILIMLSRPRPVPNLFGYWVGCLIVNVPLWLGALLALHLVPSFESFALNLAAPDPHSGVQPMKIGLGVFALTIAGVIAWRIRKSQRAEVKEPALVGAGESGAADVPDAASPPPPPPGRLRSAVTRVRDGIRKFMARAWEAWDSGAVWVSVLMGLGYIAPLSLVLLVNTMILGSGEPLGTQILAVLAFVVVMLGLLELTFLSYVVAPRATAAVLGPVHEWAQKYRMQILLALFAVVGIWQLMTGSGQF